MLQIIFTPVLPLNDGFPMFFQGFQFKHDHTPGMLEWCDSFCLFKVFIHPVLSCVILPLKFNYCPT